MDKTMTLILMYSIIAAMILEAVPKLQFRNSLNYQFSAPAVHRLFRSSFENASKSLKLEIRPAVFLLNCCKKLRRF
jgi:hypothetical protein